MHSEHLWNFHNDPAHLADLRREAEVSRLLGRLKQSRSVWERLLPPLRRLERWVEGRAGRAHPPADVA